MTERMVDREPLFSSCARCVAVVPRLRTRLDRATEGLQLAAQLVDELATLVAASPNKKHRESAARIRGKADEIKALSIQLLAGS